MTVDVKTTSLPNRSTNTAHKNVTEIILVHGLPTELLLHIFRMAVWLANSSNAGVRISHVCSRWRGISLNCKELWTLINVPSRKAMRFISELRRRSGDLPLSLRADITGAIEAIIQARTPKRKSNYLMNTLGWNSSDPSLNGGLDKVSLFQRFNDAGAPIAFHPLFANVRRLELDGLTEYGGFCRMSRLVELEVSNMLTLGEPTFPWAPHLERLHIRNIDFPYGDPGYWDMQVPSLEHLIVENCRWWWKCSRLKLPSLKAFHLITARSPYWFQPDSLAHFVSLAKPLSNVDCLIMMH